MFVDCNLTGCPKEGWPSEMVPVRVLFDAVPIVGMACSASHAEHLEKQWQSAGRYVAPELHGLAGVGA